MTKNACHITFSGKVLAGHDPQRVKKVLATLLNMDDRKAESLFSGRPIIFFKNISRETAEKYRAAFLRAGALCEIHISNDNTLFPCVAAGTRFCERCGSPQLGDSACPHCADPCAPAPGDLLPPEVPAIGAPELKRAWTSTKRAQMFVRASLFVFLLTAACAFLLTMQPTGPPRHLLLLAANRMAGSVDVSRAAIESCPDFKRLLARGQGLTEASLSPDTLRRLIRAEQQQPETLQASLENIHSTLEQARTAESFHGSRKATADNLHDMRRIRDKHSAAFANMLSGLEQLDDIFTTYMEHAIHPLGQASFVRYCVLYRAYLGFFMAAYETYIDALDRMPTNKNKEVCRSQTALARQRIEVYKNSPIALRFAP